jgi:hypothetical protein
MIALGGFWCVDDDLVCIPEIDLTSRAWGKPSPATCPSYYKQIDEKPSKIVRT